jgi:hypothetical membrane protein
MSLNGGRVTFSAGRLRAAGFAWVACLQYFAVEAVAAAASPGYSYRFGYISDLGATECAAVCSPRHGWMNASFVIQGVLIAAGLALAWPALGKSRLATFGKICLAVCAAGVALVGLAPENAAAGWHYFGATANLLGCNLAALALGLTGAPALHAGAVAGVVGLAACLALALRADGGLGVGVVERLAAYPFLAWLAGAGAALAMRIMSPDYTA